MQVARHEQVLLEEEALSIEELRQRANAMLALAQKKEENRKSEVYKEILAKLEAAHLSVEGLLAYAQPSGKKPAKSSGKVAKYQNPASGATWTGRGRATKWITELEASGGNRSEYAI